MSQEQQQEFSNFDLCSDDLNCELTFSEESKAIDRAKCGKAYLDIPNAKSILHRFFNLCFVTGLNPSDWDYSIIKPIPKPTKTRVTRYRTDVSR